MRKLSLKRRKQNRKYLKLRLEYLDEHPYCESGLCPRMLAIEIHHKKGRTAELLTDARYFLAVCRCCHDYIENNVSEAKEKGLSLSRLEK